MLFPFINSGYIDYIKFFVTLVAFVCSYSYVNKMIGRKERRFLNAFVVIYLSIVVISFCYTVVSMYDTLYRAFSYSKACFAILSVYPLIYVGIKYKQNINYLEPIIAFIVFIQVLRIINVLIYEYSGITLLDDFIAVQVRNSHHTVVSNALDHFVPVFCFYLFLNSDNKTNKRRYIIYSIISFVFVARFITSRMMIVAVLSSIVMMWVVNQKFKRNTIITVAILTIAVAFFINTSFYQDLITSITSANANDFSRGIYGNSVSARLLYIKTIQDKQFSRLLGMGMVSYGSARYNYLFPEGAAEDLGYLGDYYMYGMLIIIPIAMLFIYNVMLLKKCVKRKYADLLAALVVFLSTTGVTLSVFGIRKIFLLPILLSIFVLIEQNLNSEIVGIKRQTNGK